MNQDSLIKIVREEISKQEKVKNLTSRLSEVNKKLHEIGSNLPEGYEDPADQEIRDFDIYDYNIKDEMDSIEIIFSDTYLPLEIDTDTLISYTEKKYNIKYKSDDVGKIISTMEKKNMLEKYIQDYIYDHPDELEQDSE